MTFETAEEKAIYDAVNLWYVNVYLPGQKKKAKKGKKQHANG